MLKLNYVTPIIAYILDCFNFIFCHLKMISWRHLNVVSHFYRYIFGFLFLFFLKDSMYYLFRQCLVFRQKPHMFRRFSFQFRVIDRTTRSTPPSTPGVIVSHTCPIFLFLMIHFYLSILFKGHVQTPGYIFRIRVTSFPQEPQIGMAQRTPAKHWDQSSQWCTHKL